MWLLAESTNMLVALCLLEMPKLDGNNCRMWADKAEFLLTQFGVDYASTAEKAPQGSSRSYEKDNWICCGLLMYYMTDSIYHIYSKI